MNGPDRIGQWRTRAACLGSAPADGTEAPHPWFPVKGAAASTAKACCRTCPVRAECLLDAIESNDQYGIRGGVAEPDRRVLRRAWVTDGRRAGPEYRMAVVRVFLRLDDPVSTPVLDRNGGGAMPGRASSHGRGLRDPWTNAGKGETLDAPKGRDRGWAA